MPHRSIFIIGNQHPEPSISITQFRFRPPSEGLFHSLSDSDVVLNHGWMKTSPITSRIARFLGGYFMPYIVLSYASGQVVADLVGNGLGDSAGGSGFADMYVQPVNLGLAF